MRVFGSLARGDDDPQSDIDLLVEISDAGSAAAELLTVLGLSEELSQLVLARVDVAEQLDQLDATAERLIDESDRSSM